MKCPVCDGEITSEDKKYMLGVDKPYMNSFLHFSCWLQIKDNYRKFILENAEKMYDYAKIK